MADAAVDADAEMHFDQLDDDKALKIEATEVVKEIAYAVSLVQISTVLPADVNLIYINITTKENQHLCVELTLRGFRVVGNQFNEVNPQHHSRHYETIYSLLDSYSAEYRNAFCETLSLKLLNLQQHVPLSGEDDQSDDQMDTK